MNLKYTSHYYYFFLWIILALISGPVFALDSDKDKPINVEADKADIDDKRGISTYTGNVIVIQGSIRITSDTLTLYTKNHAIEKIIAKGNPAKYTQRPEGEKNDIYAQGEKIEFHKKTDTAIFINNAIMKQGGNTFKSNRITYDISSNKVNAGTQAGGERVTITIQPETKKPVQASPQPDSPTKEKSKIPETLPSMQNKSRPQ